MGASNALGADGNTSIRSGFQRGPQAPNLRPPGASRGGAPDGTLLLLSQSPSPLGPALEFAVRRGGMALQAQGVAVRVLASAMAVWRSLAQAAGRRCCQPGGSRSALPLA